MNPNIKNLLVTGGAGFIGANFVHYWLKKYSGTLVVLDALTYAGNRANLSLVENIKNFHFVQGDIGDIDLTCHLIREHNIDTIVNFAAESHVDRSISGPDIFIETNIVGTHTLLKAARKMWLETESPLIGHRFHHVSTDEVYGTLETGEPAFTELTAYAPNSPYSASKAASDHLVRAYHQTYGLNVTISHCSNNYGPYQFPEKLIPLVITNILQNQPIPIFGDGKQIRDWLYVDDHSYGLELILMKGVPGQNYNIGDNNEWQNLDIVNLICKKVDNFFLNNTGFQKQYPQAHAAMSGKSNSLIRFVKDRPGHDRRYAIDADKAFNALGFKPSEPFDKGINKTIQWYLENPGWWLNILKGNRSK